MLASHSIFAFLGSRKGIAGTSASSPTREWEVPEHTAPSNAQYFFQVERNTNCFLSGEVAGNARCSMQALVLPHMKPVV